MGQKSYDGAPVQPSDVEVRPGSAIFSICRQNARRQSQDTCAGDRCLSLTFAGTCLSRRSPLSVRRDSSPPRKPARNSQVRNGRHSRQGHRALLTSSACPGRSMLSFPVLMSQTFSVLSLLPLTSSLLSADHATWYTDPTWPRREVRYLEVDVRSYNCVYGAIVWKKAVLHKLLTFRCVRPKF